MQTFCKYILNDEASERDFRTVLVKDGTSAIYDIGITGAKKHRSISNEYWWMSSMARQFRGWARNKMSYDTWQSCMEFERQRKRILNIQNGNA